MITNPVSLLDMAANFAINACFGLAGSKWGQQRQGSIMGASVAIGLADMFLQIFLGGSGSAQPEAVGVTSSELKGDLDELRAELDDDLFEAFQLKELANVQTIENNWKHAWAAACRALQSNTGDPLVDDQLNQDWSAYYASFQAESTGATPATLEVCNCCRSIPSANTTRSASI